MPITITHGLNIRHRDLPEFSHILTVLYAALHMSFKTERTLHMLITCHRLNILHLPLRQFCHSLNVLYTCLSQLSHVMYIPHTCPTKSF